MTRRTGKSAGKNMHGVKQLKIMIKADSCYWGRRLCNQILDYLKILVEWIKHLSKCLADMMLTLFSMDDICCSSDNDVIGRDAWEF